MQRHDRWNKGGWTTTINFQIAKLGSIEITQSMKTSAAAASFNEQEIARSVSVYEVTDPTSAGENIEVISQDVVQLEDKPLRVQRIVVRLGESIVVFHHTNLPVRTRTRLQDAFVAYTAFGAGAVGSINGIPIAHDKMSAAPGGAEGELIVNAGYESVAFLICPTFLRFHLETRQLDLEIRIPEGIQVLTPDVNSVRRLFSWGRSLSRIASRQPDLFDKPETKASAQGEMIELLLDALKSAELSPATKIELTRERHSSIVQAAEDYVLSHPSGHLYLTDLCKATDVSVRTLQYAFQEVIGMTPMAYLTKLRLHRVRQSLRLADHASTTVSQEATRWGFWHFGDFSRAYKDCFGELPSDTLRRPPDAGKPK